MRQWKHIFILYIVLYMGVWRDVKRVFVVLEKWWGLVGERERRAICRVFVRHGELRTRRFGRAHAGISFRFIYTRTDTHAREEFTREEERCQRWERETGLVFLGAIFDAMVYLSYEETHSYILIQGQISSHLITKYSKS